MQNTQKLVNSNTSKIIGNTLIIVYMLAAFLCDTAITVHHGTFIQRVAGVTGILLLFFFCIKLLGTGKQGIISYIKANVWLIAFFVMRLVSCACHGFDYTIIRQIFFEAVYLVPIAALLVDRDLVDKIIVKLFLLLNLAINILDCAAIRYLTYCANKGIQSGLADWINNNTYGSFLETRLYDNPNHMGLITALAVVLALGLLKNLKNWWSIALAVLYYCFSLYIVWKSNCRNAILCLAVVLLAFAIKLAVKRISAKQMAIACLICVTISTFGIYGFILMQGHPNELNPTEQKIDLVSSGRYSIWKTSTYVHKDDFLIGGGSITLEKIQRYDYDKEHNGRWGDYVVDPRVASVEYVGPHNAYIGIISTAGIIAFIFYMICLYLKIKRSDLVEKMPYMLSVVYILVMNVLECRLITGLNIYCAMLYIILAPEVEDDKKLLESDNQLKEVTA